MSHAPVKTRYLPPLRAGHLVIADVKCPPYRKRYQLLGDRHTFDSRPYLVAKAAQRKDNGPVFKVWTKPVWQSGRWSWTDEISRPNLGHVDALPRLASTELWRLVMGCDQLFGPFGLNSHYYEDGRTLVCDKIAGHAKLTTQEQAQEIIEWCSIYWERLEDHPEGGTWTRWRDTKDRLSARVANLRAKPDKANVMEAAVDKIEKRLAGGCQ